MESFIETLELLKLRLECGYTLRQSLQGVPKCKIPKKTATDWNESFQQMLQGEIPALSTLNVYIEKLKFENKISQKLGQSTLSAKIQLHLAY